MHDTLNRQDISPSIRNTNDLEKCGQKKNEIKKSEYERVLSTKSIG